MAFEKVLETSIGSDKFCEHTAIGFEKEDARDIRSVFRPARSHLFVLILIEKDEFKLRGEGHEVGVGELCR